MSEPMSTGEIEDVLSSIRKLVSEDLRPVGKAGAAPVAAPGGAPKSSDKLLLTPALRVVSTQDLPKATLKPLPEDEADEAPMSVDVDDMHSDAPDLAITPMAAARDDDDEVAPPVAFADAAENEDWLPESNENSESFADWADVPADEGEAAEAVTTPDLTRIVSEISAGVSEAEDDWEPEVGDAPLEAVSWQAPEWVEEAEVVDDVSDAAAKAVADAAEDAAVAEILARAAQAKANTKADADPKAAGPKVEPEDDIFAQDESYFDETVLRDLVRDLIREELSGTLGERITRNVRKLVRAEINRALTARDFD